MTQKESEFITGSQPQMGMHSNGVWRSMETYGKLQNGMEHRRMVQKVMGSSEIRLERKDKKWYVRGHDRDSERFNC
jgi:hypothetical protein